MNNRELKFRAWDKEYKWFTSVASLILLPHCLDTTGDIIPHDPNDLKIFEFSAYEKERFIVQQYTGSKDKENNEIYEGDIIKYFYWDYNEDGILDQQTYYAKVKFDHGQWLMMNEHNHCIGSIFGNESTIKIAGNIFQNPELLLK